MTKIRTRPTKKQYELLKYIEQFISEKGYGPSYREIMRGCNYSSVATVAAHVKNLAAAGKLLKNGRSARSLEVINQTTPPPKIQPAQPDDEKWLIQKIDKLFADAEAGKANEETINKLYVLVGALKILGFEAAANAFKARLNIIKNTYL